VKINSNYNKFINIQTYKSNDILNTENKINKNNSVNIEISDSARALVDKINQSNDIKYTEKVEKIRKDILEGNYKVSPEVIAEKMLKTMEEEKGREL